MLIPSQVQHSIYKEAWSGCNATCSAYLWSQHQHRSHTPDKNIIAIDVVKRSKFKSDIRRMKVDLFQCGAGRKTCVKEAIQVLQQLTNMCVAGGCGWQLWRTVIVSEKVGFWNTWQASIPPGNARRRLTLSLRAIYYSVYCVTDWVCILTLLSLILNCV